jgi:hypothetical protein
MQKQRQQRTTTAQLLWKIYDCLPEDLAIVSVDIYLDDTRFVELGIVSWTRS